MAAPILNPEPADPVAREEHELPPKSYADAVEEGLTDDDDGATLINEDDIKETPPRPKHARKESNPRPYGEVMDEAEAEEDDAMSSPLRSPSLRHPKGRLEDQEKDIGGKETYAEVAKEGVTEPKGNGHLLSVDEKHASGIKTPDTFEGKGGDEEPRSPTRRAHKRISSKNLNGSAKKAPQQKENESPKHRSIEPAVDGANGDGTMVYENVYNKSGENLASLRPGDGYFTSLAQRKNKNDDASIDPPQSSSSHPTDLQRQDSNELVSGRRAGAGWASSAIRWAPFNIPIQRRLQTLIVLLHTLSIAGLLAIFFLLCGIPLLWPILVPYLIYVLISPAGIDGKLSKRSDWARRSKIWSLFASYFPARLHRSEKLEPTRKYIFGYHPHGIISHGGFAAFATEALGFSQLFPGITNTLLTLDANFRIPLYRDYILRMGLCSVSRESCENILTRGGPNNEGMGRAITIVVGGARESLDGRPFYLRLVLKRRKGFVKLAIRTGADLVPVLAFGENDLYDQLDTESHPYIHRMQMLVKKALGFTVPLFHARGVFNYDVGLMPYRRPINVVVGRPIKISQSKTPDPTYVDEMHELYVKELVRIWEEWKDVFARNRKGELEIVD